MKFKLIYRGEVKIHPKKRAQHIHAIRKQLSSQLEKLLEIPPYSKIKDFMTGKGQKKKDIARHMQGIDFIPVISPSLHLLAELDVQLLHPELLGTPRADIDNRMKTLLDGLRRPQNQHEIPESAEKGGKFFVLLDDDSLVTKLSVNTSHWLNATNPEDLLVIITVNIRASKGTIDNLDFII
ncbi:MAG: hypothetical protein ACTSXL_00870 [Alphaproteobacteria bacterium]|nr:MAG: hypothetical protein B6I23_01125 [Rickettsiaceae bacterium 4572_127]